MVHSSSSSASSFGFLSVFLLVIILLVETCNSQLSLTPTRSPNYNPLLCPNTPWQGDSKALDPTDNVAYFIKAYKLWKTRYLKPGPLTSTLKVIDPNDCLHPRRTTSESIGLGMLLAVANNDRVTFDKLWAFANYFRGPTGLMASVIKNNNIPAGGALLDGNPSAEIDMAFALLMAQVRWSNATYYQNAVRVMNAVYKVHVGSDFHFNYFPVNKVSSGSLLNPGAYSLFYFRIFSTRSANATQKWNMVQTVASKVLADIRSRNSNSHLVPDYAFRSGSSATKVNGYTSWYCRNGTYVVGKESSVVSPLNTCTQWPFTIAFDPTSTSTSFIFNTPQVFRSPNVGLGGRALKVFFNCGTGWIQAGKIFYGGNKWSWRVKPATACTFPGSKGYAAQTATVSIRVFTDTNRFYEFSNVDSVRTCPFTNDQFGYYYGTEAVKDSWRTALDASYFGSLAPQSVDKAVGLYLGSFSHPAWIDGPKFLGGASLFGQSGNMGYRSSAIVYHINNPNSVTRLPMFDVLRSGLPSNLLPSQTYFADTLQTLTFVLTSGSLNSIICNVIKNKPPTLPSGFNLALPQGPGFRPAAGSYTGTWCLRNSTQKNIDMVSAWSMAIEFSKPTQLARFNVQINCGTGNRVALTPVPDLLNTRYITSACNSTSVTVTLTPKPGFSGSAVVLKGATSTKSCTRMSAVPAFCWNSNSGQYYLSLTTGYQLTSLKSYCYKPGGSLIGDAWNATTEYPWEFTQNVPTGCSPTGKIHLIIEKTRVVTTNYTQKTSKSCPTFCFDYQSGTSNFAGWIAVRFQTPTTGVTMNCGTGVRTAIKVYNGAWGIFGNGCNTNGSIVLTYTQNGVQTRNVVTNYKTAKCYSAEATNPLIPLDPVIPDPPTLHFRPFCFGPGSTRNYLDVRTYQTNPAWVKGVFVFCSELAYILNLDPAVPGRFFRDNVKCPNNDVVVQLIYNTTMIDTYGNDVTDTWAVNLFNDRCSVACYQPPKDQYYLGVGLSYKTRNATLSCPGTAFTGSVTMTIGGGGYFAGASIPWDSQLYSVLEATNSDCTKIRVYISQADQNGGPIPGPSGYYTLTGPWYQSILPNFIPLSSENPNRCKF